LDTTQPLYQQIPADVDFVHYQTVGDEATKKPYLVTIHGNTNNTQEQLNINSVFISANQAARYGAATYVHNGVNFADYPKPDLFNTRKRVHFLANAAWKVKNVKGAIRIAKMAGKKLDVLGGYRFNFNMGIRLTFDTHVRFHGQVDMAEKSKYLNQSQALLFPVLWNEPFGVAMVESLYYGCPVLGTTYGSLPEIVQPQVGFLSNSYRELADALKNIEHYKRTDCHQYATDVFSASEMTDKYLKLYEKLMNGATINTKQPQLLEAVSKYLPMND
jgi:glycosyltransferase involved in cell wall biosynthesis